ncbi:MAG: hypothetical protein J5537_12890, partial [Lachnospiraceae bacterium]|nr:hypothetical protein [Lachnospiraceae bacterium]
MQIIEMSDNRELYVFLKEINLKYKNFVMYGNGEVAKLFYDAFGEIISDMKNQRVVLTQPKQGESLKGIPVEPFYILQDLNADESIVVVAAHDKFHDELLHILNLVYQG